jgi:hypothetical protein
LYYILRLAATPLFPLLAVRPSTASLIQRNEAGRLTDGEWPRRNASL